MAKASIRIWCALLVLAFAGLVWAQDVSPENASERSESVSLSESESSGEGSGEADSKNKKKKKRGSLRYEELTQADRIRYQRQMGDTDLYSKDGVPFRKSWGFRSGVTQLYPPFYDGWKNGREVKGLYRKFAEDGEAGYTLESIVFDEQFYKATGKEFVNYFALVWVPQQYAFSLFQPRNFEVFKEGVREKIVAARKGYAKREEFDTFQDYVAFKFGRDDEMENFVDGYWIEANESEEHLTYFYTSEFLVERRRQAFQRPLIATTTYLVIRNKLLKLEIAKEYSTPEDIPQLLEFTERVRDDMKIVNRHGETDQ